MYLMDTDSVLLIGCGQINGWNNGTCLAVRFRAYMDRLGTKAIDTFLECVIAVGPSMKAVFKDRWRHSKKKKEVS